MSPARRGSERSDEPQALSVVLDVLREERLLGTGLLLGTLGRRWESVVGGRLAEESVPAALDEGVLLVRASSSAWAAQIRFLSKEIRDAANRVLTAAESRNPPVREVRVVVDPGPRGR